MQLLWKIVFSQKMKVKLPYDLAIPFLGIYPTKNKSTNLKRHIHLNVHISIIFNSQDMGATQMSINREMDKEDVVCIYKYIHTHNGISLSHEKNENLPFAAT